MNKNRVTFCDLFNVKESAIETLRLEKLKSQKNLLVEEKKPGLDVTSKKKKKKIRQEEKKKSAGEKWYNLGEKQHISDEHKLDLEFLKLRNVADSKHFMKKMEISPEHAEIGTLVTHAKDYYSEKKHKGMLKDKHYVDMLIENQTFKAYAKKRRREYDQSHRWMNKKKRETR